MPQRKSSRRAFLSGQSAIDAVSELGAELPVDPASQTSGAPRTEPSYLVQIGRTAMACEFQVLLNAGQHDDATEAALEALDLVEDLEEQLSWFRETSELTKMNQRAADEAVAVEPRFFALLQDAVALSKETDAAFDITASPLWKLWGFHRREGKQPLPADIEAALEFVGSCGLTLDEARRTVSFERSGMEITLGAIGKGYALDRCAELLRDQGVDDFLIHGGHSSMLARGSRSGINEQAAGWMVALRHPLRPDQRLGQIRLRDRALGTSGSGNQFFHFGGNRYGHVLDPRTGYPADGVLSATVLAPKASQADALATAFFVMGVEQTAKFCERHPDVSVLFVCPGQQTGSIETHCIAVDEADWQRLD